MITPTFYPITGGAETMVYTTCEALHMIGVHADIMTFHMNTPWYPKWSGRTENIGGITVYKIPALNWLPITNSPRIKLGINLIPGRFRHLAKEYDVLHFHQAEFSFPLFSCFLKRPKILHLHGLRLEYYKRYYWSRVMLQKTANLYLSLSKQMKNDLLALGFPENKIVIFPNSVDTRKYYPTEKKLDNTLLFVGRITPDKGLHVLLRSLSYVKKPLCLKIIGPVNMNHDLNYYHTILSLIKNENAKGKHKIDYLGTVESRVLVKWYQNASVFVLPSLYEPFAVVILEAMSCGTPVIATYVGGIPEIVKSYKNGILVPANDPLRLAEAVDYLLDNRDIRTRFGNSARELVIRNFARELLTKKLCTIYEKLYNS
jgi:glycosyltransferase involved in cell wall biosynthesis